MTAIRIPGSSLLAIALVSCAPQNTPRHNTPGPYGTTDGGRTNPPATVPANPVYDTPAAYEESTPTNPETPAVNNPPANPAAPAHGAAIIHTVVAGDTLSGLSAKYKIPVASIKQANKMTNDTVVLGRKMVIPPR